MTAIHCATVASSGEAASSFGSRKAFAKRIASSKALGAPSHGAPSLTGRPKRLAPAPSTKVSLPRARPRQTTAKWSARSWLAGCAEALPSALVRLTVGPNAGPFQASGASYTRPTLQSRFSVPFASADVVYGILPSAGLEGEGLEGGAP